MCYWICNMLKISKPSGTGLLSQFRSFRSKLKSFQKRSSSQRTEFYIWATYKILFLLNNVPLKYSVGKMGPDSLEFLPDSTKYIKFAIPSSLSVFFLVTYWIVELSFGQTTRIEFFTVLACVLGFTTFNACQWSLLVPSTRSSGVNLMNVVLELWFQSANTTGLLYEMFCFGGLLCLCFYPFMFLPCLFAMSSYLPGALGIMQRGMDFLILGIKVGDPETNRVLLRLFIFALISVALGHGCVNLWVMTHWLFIYHFATLQTLKDLLLQGFR